MDQLLPTPVTQGISNLQLLSPVTPIAVAPTPSTLCGAATEPMDLSDKSRSGFGELGFPFFRPSAGVIVETPPGQQAGDSGGYCSRPMAPQSPASSTTSSLSEGCSRQNPATAGRNNQVGTVVLRGVPIVSLVIDDKERLCLAQISNTLLKTFSYNEIHNRRVALGITCVQCTPVQLEILRRYGAMPISSRRCGMITKREAERLVTSFLEEHTPPKLPETFAFSVAHACGWGCKGSFIPSRYNSSRAKCIKCYYCNMFLSPNKFIFHFHRTPESKYHHPDAANFNSWRRHLVLDYPEPSEELNHAWEDVKAMFNGGSRKRLASPSKGMGSAEGSRSEEVEEARKRQCLDGKISGFPPAKSGPLCLPYPRMLPLAAPPSTPHQTAYSVPRPAAASSAAYPPLPMLAMPPTPYYDTVKMHMMELWKAKAAAASQSLGMFWNKGLGFPASVPFLYRSPMESQTSHQQQARLVEAFITQTVCGGGGGSAKEEVRYAGKVTDKSRRRPDDYHTSASRQLTTNRKPFSAFSRFDSFDGPAIPHFGYHCGATVDDLPQEEDLDDDSESEDKHELINVTDDNPDDDKEDIDVKEPGVTDDNAVQDGERPEIDERDKNWNSSKRSSREVEAEEARSLETPSGEVVGVSQSDNGESRIQFGNRLMAPYTFSSVSETL